MPQDFAQQIGRSKQASTLIWHGLAESTRRGTQEARARFATFVLSRFHKHQCFPAEEEWLVEYVASQDSRQRSYHSVQRDIYSLKTWHVDLGLKVEGFGTQLERAMRGMQRLRGVPEVKAALPIELPLLQAILLQLPSLHSGSNLKMYHAAITLSFACFLRSGEVVHSHFNPKLHLSVGSVAYAPDYSYAVVTLPASKTDIARQGVKVVAPATGGLECPVLALQAITLGRHSLQPLFHTFNSKKFDRAPFIDTVKKCIARCKVSPEGFSGHSFRRGAATWASKVGYTEEEIKILGRWNSDCVRRYIDRSAAQRCALALKMYKSKPKASRVDISETWRQF